MMRRKLLIVLLGLGAIGGYAAGFAGCHMRSQRGHAGFHERVADTCAQAALRAREQAPRTDAPATPQVVVVTVPAALPATGSPPAAVPATPAPATP